MQVIAPVTYFAHEGKGNLSQCLRLSFEAAVNHHIHTIVIFTAIGEGIQLALDGFLTREEYKDIRVIGVTFPCGMVVTTDGEQRQHEFPQETREELIARGVPLIRANLPFSSIAPQHENSGVLSQDMCLLGNALNIFGGGMSLCVQAVLLACDAGEIPIGDHVVVMTADTSLIVRAAPTRGLLTDFIVRQIVCKPAFLTISKNEPPPLGDAEQAELQNETPKTIEADTGNA